MLHSTSIEVDAVPVVRQSDGSFRLRWTPRQPELEVIIHVGSNPETVHLEPPAARTRDREHRISHRAGPERPFFALRAGDREPLVVAERGFPLEGVTNFRDFGGYSTAAGRRVRWGQLYRSGELSGLSESDRRFVASLGLDAIFDLRIPEENDRAPSALPAREAARVANVPLFPGSAHAYREQLMTGTATAEGLAAVMQAINRDLARDHHADYGELIRRVAQARGPILIHCAAGKDRTGFGVALLLLALGVPLETVVADYLLSREFFDAERILAGEQAIYLQRGAPPFDPEILRPLLEVRRAYLEAGLAAVAALAESPEAYLREFLGVSEAELAQLRERLLE